MNRKFISLFACIALISSCSKEIKVLSLSLDKSQINLDVGDTYILTPSLSPTEAKNLVSWTTSNNAVAGVDNTGKVIAKNNGFATITAQAGGLSARCEVTVTTKVTSITLNKTSLTIEKGATEALIATVAPDDASDKTVTWSSSNESIVSVDQNGTVTAIKGGEATITAQAGGLSARCEVTVTTKVTSITLNKTSLTIEKGATEALIATVAPDDASDKTVTWSSSNESIVSVDQNGVVTAIKGGEATITAQAGGLSAKCEITVTAEVTSITLNKTSLTIEKGATEALIATVAPDDASDKTVTWSSSNESIVTVDQNGTVTALRKGDATITAKAGKEEASCKVVVFIKLTQVEFKSSTAKVRIGEKVSLELILTPSDASVERVEWAAGNEGIASVDGMGVVTGVAIGTTTIIAKIHAFDSVFTISCYVVVSDIQGNEGYSEGDEGKWD